MRSLRFWLTGLLAAVLLSPAGAQDSTPRLEGAGLVAYNRVVDRLDTVPVSVVYLRGDFRPRGRPYLWPALEPERGKYNFRAIVDALDRAEALGVKLGFRIMTAHPWVLRGDDVHPFFPDWIPYTAKTRGDRTAHAPDWEHEEVKSAIRNLLNALADATRNHPALLFVDVGVLGWVGEWHTTVGFYNKDFMPSVETMYEYVDYHIEAFGADKLLLNLGAMKPEVLRHGLDQGVTGIRQDCFGSTYHMDQYEVKLEQVPELQTAIDSGIVFFEICGSNMRDWTHAPDDKQGVTLPMDEIIDRAIRWKATLFANMGSPIPERYIDDYVRLHEAMAGFAKVERAQQVPGVNTE